MQIILASSSPRRRELMEQMGLTFTICPSNADENIGVADAGELVSRLAELKALDVCASHPGAAVVGSDTVVAAPNGRVLGKPKDKADAFAMLGELSGKTHTVYTGVCVAVKTDEGVKKETRVCSTAVTFRALDDEEILRYIETGEPMDKAGAYGIQGRASVMVERIDGDYFNVMGLPVCTLRGMLLRAGVKEI